MAQGARNRGLKGEPAVGTPAVIHHQNDESFLSQVLCTEVDSQIPPIGHALGAWSAIHRHNQGMSSLRSGRRFRGIDHRV